MSNKTKVVLNHGAVGALLKSPEMQSILQSHASKIAQRGNGEAEVVVAGTRAIAKVKTSNMKDNSLLKAVR